MGESVLPTLLQWHVPLQRVVEKRKKRPHVPFVRSSSTRTSFKNERLNFTYPSLLGVISGESDMDGTDRGEAFNTGLHRTKLETYSRKQVCLAWHPHHSGCPSSSLSVARHPRSLTFACLLLLRHPSGPVPCCRLRVHLLDLHHRRRRGAFRLESEPWEWAVLG